MKDKSGTAHRVGTLLMGDEDPDTAGFTKRLLMSAVFDITELADSVERVQVKLYTMAKANGVPIPEKE